MNKYPFLKKSIIVSDQDYNQMLYRYKNRFPDLNIKFITPNELIDRLSFTYKKDIVPLLIKQNIEYSKAIKLAKILRLADLTKSDKLKAIYDSIPSEYISRDPYGLMELENVDIYLFELKEDVELKAILKRHNLAYKDLSFDDLGFEVSPSFLEPNLIHFQNKNGQFAYIFSDIRRKLLEDPSLQNKIRIVIKDDSDLFYIKSLSKLYGIECFARASTPLLSNSDVKKKMNEIHSNKNFIFTSEEMENPYLKSLRDLISTYGLESLEDFNYAYSNLLEIVSSNSYTYLLNDRGIMITNKYSFNSDSITYITNFQDGCFYKTYDDKDALIDKELVEVDVNPSYVKTRLDRTKKFNYIKYQNVVLFSRVKQHLADSIYDSQFILEDELNWKKLGKLKSIETDFNLEGVYTDDANKLFIKDQYDRNKFKDDTFLKENTYDNSFKGISSHIKELDKPTYSVTKLEKYILCPFKYYLDTVLPSKDNDLANAFRGVLTHKVFENINHEDYDFEKAFEEGKKEYIKSIVDNGQVYSNREEVYVNIIYYWLKKFIPTYLKVAKNINIIPNNNDHEIQVYYTLYDEDGKAYKFSGKIDKVIWSKSGDNEYYTIVDYKSGKEEFEPSRVFLGASTQLPLYYYAIEEQNYKVKGNRTFGGFGILHNYFSTIKAALNKNGVLDEKILINNSSLTGLANVDLDYIASIDSSMEYSKAGKPAGGDFLKIKTLFKDPHGEEAIHGLSGDRISKYNLDDLIEDAKKATIKTIKAIENHEFQIKPSTFGTKIDSDSLPCKFCSHKNICYKKITDSYSYYNDIQAKFSNHPVMEEIEIEEEESDDE